LADILFLGNRWPVGEEPGALREERTRGGASSNEGWPATAVCRADAEEADLNSVRSLDLKRGTIEIVACLSK